jgi:hypothetical protein
MSGIAVTFPSSPVEGQTYLAQNGFTYIYDSQKNRWKRGGEFVRSPKVLSYAGVAVTTVGVTTGPTGALVYEVPGFVVPNSEVGVDSYKAYRAAESYPDYTEVQVSISSAFSTIAYAATFTGTTHTIPATTLQGDATYYLRARQFVGSSAASAGVGAISGYSPNIVSFATTSTFIDTPTIVSISGSTSFPVYQVGFVGAALPATVTYTGSGVNNLDKVEWRVTGPRIPSSTGDTALAEIGIGTFSSATLANALVLAMPFSGATGVGITNDVNNAIRTASGASSGTTKTITASGGISTSSIAGINTLSHFYDSAADFSGNPRNGASTGTDYLTTSSSSDFAFGTGDFTMELWVYSPTWNGGSSNKDVVPMAHTNPTTFFYITGTSGGELKWYDGSTIYSPSPTVNLSSAKWIHLASVRRSGIVSLFVDGVRVHSFSNTVSYGTGTFVFGRGPANNLNAFYGYMQDAKVYNFAKYQENFTPPLPTYGTLSYTTGTTNTGINTTSYFQSTGDVGIAETSSTAADALVLALPMNRTFGFQDINVAIRGLTSGASAGTAKTVGLGTTSTANAPSHPIISATESKWYDGAAYFDGGDYGEIVGMTIDNTFVQGDYTIEGWVYPTDTNESGAWGITGNQYFGTRIQGGSDNFQFSGGGTPAISMGTSLKRNTWNHLSMVKSGTTGYGFVNGILVGTTTVSSPSVSSTNLRIGLYYSTVYLFRGYLQDFKIYKGLAKYTENFTPPQPICGFSTDLAIQTGFTTTTATGALLSSVVGLGSTSTLAFSADLNLASVTSITSSSGISTLPDPYAQNLVLALPLANITGVGNSFTNDRNTQIRIASLVGGGSTKTITNVGVSTVSLGSTSKWYGNTASFNGSTGFLSIPYSTDFDFSSSNFTIECWFNPSILSGEKGIIGINGTSQSTTGIVIRTSGTTLQFWVNGFNTITSQSGSISSNLWNHIALVRNSSTNLLFLNGTLVASSTATPSMGTITNVVVGRTYGDSSSEYSNGYLQDLKIYKGTAKYTTNFTPPPPMFGEYTRSTPNKVIFTPASDYVLEARNTSGIITSNYSTIRQWGTVAVPRLSINTVNINNSFPQTSMGNLISDGTYLYSAYAPNTSYIYRTSNLSTWTQVATTSGSYRGALFYANGVYFNFSGSNDAGINRSTNGTTWTAVSIPDNGGSTTSYVKYNSARGEFVFGGGSWASNNVFRKSTDNGITLTTTRAVNSAYGNGGMQIETSNGSGPTAYMAVNTSNTNSTPITYDISVSNDGTTWTETDWTTKFGTTPSVKGLYYLNGYYYVFTRSIFARLSLGSTSFSQITYPFNIPPTVNSYGKFTFNGIDYAYLSGPGEFFLSIDGLNWYKKQHQYTSKTLSNFMVHQGIIYADDGADFYSLI